MDGTGWPAAPGEKAFDQDRKSIWASAAPITADGALTDLALDVLEELRTAAEQVAAAMRNEAPGSDLSDAETSLHKALAKLAAIRSRVAGVKLEDAS